MAIEELSFLDLARTQSIGPISIGKTLNEVGATLGPPKYWGFGPGREFSMFGTFRDIEVHCRSIADIVTIFYAELRWSRFKSRLATIYSNSGTRLVVRCPEQPRNLTLEYLSKYFDDAGLRYYTTPNEPVMHTTTGTIRFGESLSFFFAGKVPLLEVISLS